MGPSGAHQEPTCEGAQPGPKARGLATWAPQGTPVFPFYTMTSSSRWDTLIFHGIFHGSGDREPYFLFQRADSARSIDKLVISVTQVPQPKDDALDDDTDE